MSDSYFLLDNDYTTGKYATIEQAGRYLVVVVNENPSGASSLLQILPPRGDWIDLGTFDSTAAAEVVELPAGAIVRVEVTDGPLGTPATITLNLVG